MAMGEAASNNSLHEAAREGNVEAVRQHLSANAENLNARDRLSRTPYPRLLLLLRRNRLHLAAWAGQADVVRVLCNASADVGAAALDDMAAIHFASQKGHTSVVRILLASGAYVNAKNRKGMTPLHFAVQGKRADLTKLLIEKGANLSTENKAGKRPIHLVHDESFHALIRDAELERNARRAKRQTSGREEAAGPERQGEEIEVVRPATLPERSVTVPRTQNEEVFNGKSHSRNDVEQRTEVDVVSEREVEENRSIEPKTKKAKVNLSRLSFGDDNEDESNGS